MTAAIATQIDLASQFAHLPADTRVQARRVASRLTAWICVGRSLTCTTAQERDIRGAFDLQKVTYGLLREQGLASQAAVRTIKKVIDAVKTKRANLKAGNYGKKGSARTRALRDDALTRKLSRTRAVDSESR